MAKSSSRSSHNSAHKGSPTSSSATEPISDKAGLWGFLTGLIVAAFIAVPLSAAVSFATHPATKQLFGGRLDSATQGGYAAFWWIVALLLVALPFLVGFGVAKLSARTLAIIGSIVIVLIVVVVVLGQMFLV